MNANQDHHHSELEQKRKFQSKKKPKFIALASFANIWRAHPSVQIKTDHNNEFEQYY
jgi:hypothetical protein